MESLRSWIVLAIVLTAGTSVSYGCGFVDVSKCYAPLLRVRELFGYCRALPETRNCITRLKYNDECLDYIRDSLDKVLIHLDNLSTSKRCKRYERRLGGGESRPSNLIYGNRPSQKADNEKSSEKENQRKREEEQRLTRQREYDAARRLAQRRRVEEERRLANQRRQEEEQRRANLRRTDDSRRTDGDQTLASERRENERIRIANERRYNLDNDQRRGGRRRYDSRRDPRRYNRILATNQQ